VQTWDLPIFKDETGQLFADLALTSAATVSISLLVAVTVLPAAAASWLRNTKMHDPHAHWWDNTCDFIMRLTDTPRRRAAWIVGLITIPLMVAVLLKPEADYLPNGNRNLVLAFILPPPGTSVDTLGRELVQVVAERMHPCVGGVEEPKVHDYFFVAFGRGVFMGARTEDPTRSGELVPLINRLIGGFPDTIAFARKSSLLWWFWGWAYGRRLYSRV